MCRTCSGPAYRGGGDDVKLSLPFWKVALAGRGEDAVQVLSDNVSPVMSPQPLKPVITGKLANYGANSHIPSCSQHVRLWPHVVLLYQA